MLPDAGYRRPGPETWLYSSGISNAHPFVNSTNDVIRRRISVDGPKAFSCRTTPPGRILTRA